MSYVLDALRRADAERSHGLASTLVPPASFGSPAGTKRRNAVWRRAPWLLVAGLLPLVWLALQWISPDAPAQDLSDGHEPAAEKSSRAMAAQPATAQPATALPVPAAVGATTLPAALLPAVPAPLPAQRVPSAVPSEAMAEAEAEAAAGGPARPLLRPEVMAAPTLPAPRPRVSSDTPGPNDEAETDEQQADLPAVAVPRPVLPPGGAQTARNLQARAPLVRPAPAPAAAGLTSLPGRPDTRVSGATYSENPEHRMLIVNGQVVHEGSELLPGHVVEAIGQRSAVIKHQGTRYNINY